MFGHDDMNPQQGNTGGMPLPQPDATLTHDNVDPVAPAPHPAAALPATTTDDDQPDTAPIVDDTNDDSAGDYIMTDAPQAADPAPAMTASTPAPMVAGSVSPDDLLDIKQNALQQLTPLLGHLDQSPEERFRTTMMMIQASDNQDLLKAAYEAAQQIEDEKTRAQALLDVVNEINYFTQQGSEGGQADDQEAM
jgi:hypothetical protein